MSNEVQRRDPDEVLGIDSGLEALRQSPEFQGPVEPLDDHEHSNDHLALVYESRDEQFAAAIPFIRQGLERNEQCLYIADENSKDDVLEAMRAYGIDVDAALDSGALSIYTKRDTYLRNGTFDPDDRVGFLDGAIAEATEEYRGLRVTGEMTWVLDDEPDLEALLEYEGQLNNLFPGVDSIALCQYNRERFPPEVIRDVLRTHPHLIYDHTVSHNVYYTPPEEFFGPEQPAREVDRMLGMLRERTQTKAKLEEQHEYFRRVFESSHDALLVVDPELDEIADANPAAYEMLGYPREELLSLGPSDLHPDEIDEFRAFVGEVFESGAGWTDELTCLTKDRGQIPAEISASQIEVDDRLVMLAAVRDISERKENEKHLRRKEQELTDFFENATVGMHWVGPDGTVLRVNQAELDLLGYDHDEYVGRHIADFHADQDVIDDILQQLGAGEELHDYEARMRCKDGSIRHVLISSNVLWENGEFTHTRCITRDITERKRAEDALRQSERRFREMIDSIPEAVYTTDVDGRLTHFNPAAAEFSGRTPELGTDEWCVTWKLFWPDGTPMPHDECPMAVAMKEGRSIRGAEAIAERPDGTRIWFEAYPTPLRDDDGEIVGGVNMLVDVTERKKHERAQRKLYEIAADADRPFDEKLEAVLDLGCERFDIELGGLARVDVETDSFEVEVLNGEHDHLVPGEPYPLSETYCRLIEEDGETAAVTGAVAGEFEGKLCYDLFGVRTYLGTYLELGGSDDMTFFFVSNEPRDETFSEAERTFHHLMGQWVKHELERERRERHQRSLYEIAADTSRTFEEKLQALFDLGCERFDLELGGVGRIDPATGLFEVEATSGDHEHLVPGARVELSETYCRVFADRGGTVGISDPADEGLEGTVAYDEFGLRAYLGTRIELDGDLDRTFFFVSPEPRQKAFSKTERTFHRLMGQWVKYELERKHREDRLAGLNTLSRELMDAETATEVCERVADAADGSLQLPVTAIALYDEREGALRPAAVTTAGGELLRATSLLAVGDSVGWTAFVENERRREVDPLDGQPTDVRLPITELIALPLGNQGVLLTATDACDGFGSSDLDFVEAAAGNVAEALDRADRAQELQAREAALAEQNEALERLNRVNDIIRRTAQALVRSSTRAEIESVVCEQLANHGAYELAWIGEHDAVTGEVTPRASAGAEKGYLDQVTVTADDRPTGQGPTGCAVQTREPHVVNNILDDPTYDPWRQAALTRGYHASIALPLVYEDSLYGVLNVYAGQPNVFDDLERAVLAELGETIAYAINAVESKKALVSEEVTELEFTVTDEAIDLVALSAQTDCEVSLESVVPQPDGRLRAFFSTRGIPPDQILDFAPRLAVSNVDLVSEHEVDGEVVGLFDARLTDESLCSTVLDHGGVPRDVSVVDGTARIVIGLAPDAATQEFVEMLTTKYPGSELVAKRTRERPRKTLAEYRAALTDDLTERQLEVFQTAYFSGYFEKPRSRTGSEIAASLDITQPTFNHHVRAAQRKLCGQLFEEVP